MPKTEAQQRITLSISAEDKKALKQAALDKDTTVSALVHEWGEREFLGKKRKK